MPNYTQLTAKPNPTQTQKLREDQVQNSAGGFVWQPSIWSQLDRFLILGSTGGTYYTTPKKLTEVNVDNVVKCIQADGQKTVAAIVDVSTNGRGVSNDPALFALALVMTHGDDNSRRAAFDALPRVARTGTHLYHFADFVNSMRGWGRGLRTAVGNWFMNQPLDRLAYQMTKYQQRDGWSAGDLLRLAHPKTTDTGRNAVFQYVLKGATVDTDYNALPRIIEGVEAIKRATNVAEVVRLITTYGLDREMVPTQWLNERKVWEALIAKGMPAEATLRNLAKMTSLGMMDDRDIRHAIEDTFTNQEKLTKSRLHPMRILVGHKTYAQGRGTLGSLTWNPNRNVLDAVDSAFYLSFGNVPSTGKEILLALDVSGSMSSPIGGYYSGGKSIPLSCAEGAAAMALITKNVERDARIMGFSTQFVDLDISPKMTLDQVLNKTRRMNFGATDCSLPMIWAMQNNFKAEGIAVYTDNETYAGRSHPATELANLRKKFGIESRLAVVGMATNNFTIADPRDRGMMDFVGFDTNTPTVMSAFFEGRV